MIVKARSTLSSYMTRLLSSGRVVFSREEALSALVTDRRALLGAAERQQRRHALISPRRGFYVIVPPQYLSWGAPPPSWYIDDLMRYEGHPYYVGLLKAAELHGATHQAVMEFQVATEKRLPQIRAGRSIITFHYRQNMSAIQGGIEKKKTDTGYMNVSTVELTVLDLVRYPRASGGLDNIATIISDLGSRIDSAKLAALSPKFERSVAQRLGYLLERFGHADRAGALHRTLFQGAAPPWVELEPSQAKHDTALMHEPKEQDERWRVIVRRMPERDE